LELSTLANECERLQQELRRLESRRHEIETRLAEIHDKEDWLHAYIETAARGGGSLKPMPLAEMSARVQARELSY
jgi:predicted  nucleic acid-binding Zn-ribbon protein